MFAALHYRFLSVSNHANLSSYLECYINYVFILKVQVVIGNLALPAAEHDVIDMSPIESPVILIRW